MVGLEEGEGLVGRVKAERLGRWERSEMGALSSGSEADSEASSEAEAEARLGFFFVFSPLVDACGAVESASDAASINLSSWYFNLDSNGRTPFSR